MHIHLLWYSIPLVLSVSLVYAGTRHERLRPIFGHAIRFAAWIVVFNAIIMLILAGLEHFT